MGEKTYKLSNEDLKILNVLQQNSRLSFRQISKLTNAGATTIHKKVQRWIKQCLIKKFTIDINWDLLGRSSVSYVSVIVDFPHESETPSKHIGLLSTLIKYPYVESVSSVTGRTDLVLRASARSNNELNVFLNDLRTKEGVSRTETYVSLYDAKKEGRVKPESLFKYKKTHLMILQALQENSKASLRKIAIKVGISHGLVHSYLKELIDNKVIRRFTVLLDKEKMGLPINAFVWITFDYSLLRKIKKHQEEVVQDLMKKPEVLLATAVTGRIDAILYVNAEDMYKLDHFVIGLRGIRGIRRTETLVVSHSLQKEVDNMDMLFKNARS